MTAAPQLTRLARAAAGYAARGWVVVPLHSVAEGRCTCGRADCPSPGKHPRTPRGLTEATQDLATVEGWWARWPSANIGVLPGPSGFVVLDLDGAPGRATAQDLGLLAEPTLEVVTGRGQHRWYRHPGGHIPNGQLGPGIDIRGDAGYVLVPPSVHVSGRQYAWAGRIEEVIELPPAIIARIRGTPDGGPPAGPRPDQLPAWMIPWLEVGEGGRNSTMARFVGWCFAKGHDLASVQAMALGVNAQWVPPLEAREVEAVVRSIAAAEAKRPARLTSTGTTLAIAQEPAPPLEEPSLAEMARQQVEAAVALGQRDLSDAPTWAWPDLARMVGAMLPGDLWVVGALTGNGKTSFLMSEMQHLADQRRATLYLPLELDPTQLRRRWAAWHLGLEWVHVARNEWDQLGEGAQEALTEQMRELAQQPYVHFPADRRPTMGRLAQWIRRSVEEADAKVVFVDHFHRLDFGTVGTNYRVQVTDAVRTLKDLAREHGVAVLVAAQLNQDAHAIDRYCPPVLRRLKESAGIGEEADVVLMLSRKLKVEVEPKDLSVIHQGLKSERDFEEPNVMVVTCRKHRLDDGARDRSIRLFVRGGRVESYLPWSPALERFQSREDA